MNGRPILSVKPSVSDHALVRFLQRSGMDVERVRNAVAESLAVAHGAAQSIGGPDHLVVVGELMFVVRDGVVVTTLPAGSIGDRAHALARRDRHPEGCARS